MAKKKKKAFRGLSSRRLRFVVLPVMGVVAIGAIVLAVITIIVMPKADQGAQRGVGANGFRAFEEKDGNLGVGKVVTKAEVTSELGNKAKSVDDAVISSVFNIDGTRGQTATYPFTRTDGTKVSLYVDVMLFKNTAALNSANVYNNTLKAGKVNGRDVYYMHALTIGKDREYRLLVVNGLKVYKFVVSQPLSNITISEVSALAVLKKLVAKAEL